MDGDQEHRALGLSRGPTAPLGVAKTPPRRCAAGQAAGSERLRLALVAPPWFELPPQGYGGIERMVAWLADGLAGAGVDVTVIGAGRSHLRAGFVATTPDPPDQRRLGQPLPEAVHTARAARLLAELAPTLVHDHTLLGPLLAAGRQAPTVVTAHGPVDGELREYYRSLGTSVALVAISEAQRAAAPDLGWVGVVHNGVPVTRYPFRQVKDDYVLFLGRMSAEKGAHLAVRAARAAGRHLVMAAKCNEPAEHAYFEERVRPLLAADVTWLGQVGRARALELLAGAACLVFPIQWPEPFGLVMVEALACGTPVAALRAGSVAEVLADGRTGAICDDPAELAGAIERATWLDPVACRQEAAARFDVHQMVAGYLEVYHRLLAGGRPAPSAAAPRAPLSAHQSLSALAGGLEGSGCAAGTP